MQSMIRRALLALVAVLALGVVASASASAATCSGTVEKGAVALCVEGKEQLTENQFTGETVSKEPEFTTTFLDEGAELGAVNCGVTATTTGSFKPANAKLEVAKVVVKTTSCKLTTPGFEQCTLEKPPVIDGGEGNGTGPGLAGAVSNVKELTLGKSSSRFTMIHFKNVKECFMAAAEGGVIKNAKTCELPEATAEAVTHVLYCGTSMPSSLKWGSEGFGDLKLGFSQTIKLTSGKKWSLYQA